MVVMEEVEDGVEDHLGEEEAVDAKERFKVKERLIRDVYPVIHLISHVSVVISLVIMLQIVQINSLNSKKL